MYILLKKRREIFLPLKLLFLIVISIYAVASQAAVEFHKPFDTILRENVFDGEVNYKGINEDANFAQYIKSLEAKPNFSNKNEELTYWINAYNALAIKGILDGRSPSTLFGKIGYFKNAKYKVGGKKINLYDLEHKVIIPLGEPRIHFAINCASESCPKLLSRVYTAKNLDSELDKVTIAFINDPTRNKFDKETKIVHLSKIFDWFKKDFKKHSGSVQKYIAQYVNDLEIKKALQADSYTVRYLKYDWSLNGTAP